MTAFFRTTYFRGYVIGLALLLLVVPGIFAQSDEESNAPVMADYDMYHLDGMGFKAGLGIVNFTDKFKYYTLDTLGDDITATKLGDYDYESRKTVTFGIFLTAPIYNNLAIQPEVLYTSRGAKVERNDAYFNGTLEYRLHYLEFPILLRMSLPTGKDLRPYLLAGPGIAVNIGAKSKIEGHAYNEETEEWEDAGSEEDIDGLFKGIDWELVVGAGVDYKVGPGKIFIEARYVMGLSVIYSYGVDTLPDGMEAPDEHNSAINILAGYSFF
ncbi:MAG: PorT family protein [candidate division Zixibacteria bacterium]|nr:PorT family protein [candidate division Zixibacteria bacterium]